MDKKGEKGITLIALTITIIVLIIIAGISIQGGTTAIKMARLEEIKTNMLLMQAKARQLVEDVNFKMGIEPDKKTPEEKENIRRQVYEEEAKLEKAQDIPENFGIENTSTCYWLTEEAQKNWGLDKMEIGDKEAYLIQFKENDLSVEIYSTVGYNEKFSLTEIDKIQE